MLFDDTYRTIQNPSEGIFADRGSKFLSFAYPITTEQDLKTIIAKLRAEHPKANHHCWAMRLGIDRSVFKLNDDGEPGGTAGRPILNVLLSQDVTNLVLVVVRYFGGTLLGVPGLINAYKQATLNALANSVIVAQTVNDIYDIIFDYAQMNAVMHIIKDDALTVLAQQLDNSCQMQLAIRKTQVNNILLKLNNLTDITLKFVGTR